MPNAPDHLDPKEATEAKLCAYLEGELSTDDRVDIEKHLKANPQHRQLLIDLAETRQWMRSIPKESAPPELAEAFAAQMERSMLLDAGSGTRDSTISRLPQYALIAAIVMLTLGLGVLIAVMLRGGQQTYTVGPAVKPSSGLSTVPRPAVNVPAGDMKLADALKSKSAAADKPAAVPAELVPPVAMTPPVASAVPEAPAAARRAATAGLPMTDLADREDVNRIASVMRDRNMPTGHAAIGLLVTTPDPSATADQVRRFFSNQQVAFDDGQPINPRLDEHEPAAAAAVTNKANTRLTKDGGAAVGGRLDQVAANNNNNSSSNQNAVQNYIANDRDLKQSPVNDKSNSGLFSAGNQAQNSAKSLATTQPEPLALQTAIAGKTASELVYVGHALTPLQLELLHGTLATGGIDQTVQRIDLSQTDLAKKSAAPATGPSTISKGQTLTVTVPQLVGPGIEKTNIVKVADDGTINLPMLDPVSTTGTSAADLQDRIAAKYREANLIPAATVTVTLNSPTTLPATQPAVIAPIAATTMPAASQPAVVANAATQPADNGKVDVIVYVRKAK